MEARIIAAVLKKRDFRALLDAGITDYHFKTQKGKKWFAYLQRYHMRFRKTPTKELFRKRFPDFKFARVRGTIPELAEQFIENATLKTANTEINRIVDLLEDNDENIAAEMMVAAQRVARNTARQDVSRLSDMWKYVEKYKNEDEEVSGIDYGVNGSLSRLDSLTGGVYPGEFIVIAGRSEVGKSNFTRRLVGNFYRQRKKTLIFTLEEPRDEVLLRFQSMFLKLPFSAIAKIGDHRLDDEQLERWEKASRSVHQWYSDIVVISGYGGDGNNGLAPIDIVSGIERYRPDVVVIDGAYMMQADSTSRFSLEWQNIGRIFRELRLISLQYNKPLIAVTQTNRNAQQTQKRGNDENEDDDKVPNLGDLSYADAVGQLASTVFILKRSSTKNRYLNLFVTKNRRGERRINPIRLQVNWELQRMREI